MPFRGNLIPHQTAVIERGRWAEEHTRGQGGAAPSGMPPQKHLPVAQAAARSAERRRRQVAMALIPKSQSDAEGEAVKSKVLPPPELTHHQIQGGHVWEMLGGLGEDVPQVRYSVLVGVVRPQLLLMSLTKSSNQSQLRGGVLGLVDSRSPHLSPETHVIGSGDALDLVAKALKSVTPISGMKTSALVIKIERITTKSMG
ncbi:hypothetical protein CYMTET_23083 [Cymbomonas tetramitiformis]|uniref:Uncharacterized protein n=1 Tax=Cymbomonas tetramitiformis TaxID=36881 RepID=A0AAE0L1N2_9CHLO|nr:hypothetical protein CYMTET_23083 [Cymbomonas tetramitiformis]